MVQCDQGYVLKSGDIVVAQRAYVGIAEIGDFGVVVDAPPSKRCDQGTLVFVTQCGYIILAAQDVTPNGKSLRGASFDSCNSARMSGALGQALIDGKLQGNVASSIDQGVEADKAFAIYEFGNGVTVTDASGWEYTMPGDERSRKVYVETEREDDGPDPRWTLIFTVRFDPKTGALSEAYALDHKGHFWGHFPQGNVVNDQRKLRVTYESFWDDGVVTTQATLDLETGEISDIEVADGREEMEGLQYEEISNATGVSALVTEREDGRRFLANPSLLVRFDQAGSLESAATRPATVVEKFRVLGAHPNRNFFQIEVEAIDGQHAFGVAALLLKEADEEGEAEFFATIPAATHYELPGESVVTLDTVLDPDQADVFGLAEPETVDDSPSPGM